MSRAGYLPRAGLGWCRTIQVYFYFVSVRVLYKLYIMIYVEWDGRWHLDNSRHKDDHDSPILCVCVCADDEC